MPVNTPQTSATAKTTKAKKVSHAGELALQGYSYRQIAIEMDISLSTAHGYVQAAVRKIPQAAGTALRDEWNRRLEFMWEQTRERIEKGEDLEKHVQSGIKIAERFAKLNGLDAPTQITGQVTVGYAINGVDVQALS